LYHSCLGLPFLRLKKSDSDITALIALSDAEISDRGLTGLSASALQEISMLLTAEKIVLRDPKTRVAYYC
jgi:hypothetical protein